jgi:hypothetical protein
MVNWTEFGKKQVGLEVLSQHLPEGTEENHKKSQVRITGILAAT